MAIYSDYPDEVERAMSQEYNAGKTFKPDNRDAHGLTHGEPTIPLTTDQLIERLEANAAIYSENGVVMLNCELNNLAATRLRELESRALPELPEGWHLHRLSERVTNLGKWDGIWGASIAKIGNYSRSLTNGRGNDAREAVLNAIAKIGETK